MKEPDEESREGVEIAGVLIILGIVTIIVAYIASS